MFVTVDEGKLHITPKLFLFRYHFWHWRKGGVWLCWQFSYIQTCIVVQKPFNYFFCHLCIINYRNYKQHWLKKVIYFINYFTFTISSLLCNVMWGHLHTHVHRARVQRQCSHSGHLTTAVCSEKLVHADLTHLDKAHSNFAINCGAFTYLCIYKNKQLLVIIL